MPHILINGFKHLNGDSCRLLFLTSILLHSLLFYFFPYTHKSFYWHNTDKINAFLSFFSFFKWRVTFIGNSFNLNATIHPWILFFISHTREWIFLFWLCLCCYQISDSLLFSGNSHENTLFYAATKTLFNLLFLNFIALNISKN